jgi:hypothetical protein
MALIQEHAIGLVIRWILAGGMGSFTDSKGSALDEKDGEEMKKRAAIVFAVVLGVMVGVAFGGSIALAATDQGDPSWSVANEEFIREGIPLPLIDPEVEGWFRYLGNGEFITEVGRTFYWRDGCFVNSDGTTMGLPPAAEAHLNSLGIYHQPNAQDLAKAGEGAASGDQQGTPLAAASYSSWSGRYLHNGKVWTNYLNVAGNKSTITVHNRSPKAEYYGIGMSTGPWWVGLEFCDLPGQGPDTNWVPAVHAKTDGAPVIYDWPSFGFATYGSEGSAIRELKMAVKSNYQIWFYLDSVRLQRFDKDNYIQWNSNALGLTRAESAYEIGSDLTSAPHQTANHHYGWAYQRWIGDTAWPLQTPDCSRDELYWDFQYDPAVQHRPGAYPYALWIVNPWWDWMARGWL